MALIIAVFFLILYMPMTALSADKVFIGLDAEFSHKTSTSAQSIKQGILIAIEEINRAGGVLGGRKLELIEKDNRSVPARGVENFKELAKIKDLVAVFCGKFSPVALEVVPIAHKLELPLLNPWAAIDTIVDNGYEPNYVFRLSLKDSWAIPVMMKHLKSRGINNVGILLPITSWGRSNSDIAHSYVMKDTSITIVDSQWYNWGDKSLVEKYRSLIKKGAKAIVLVANEAEGSILVKEVAALPPSERVPIVSHWGITGGDFYGLTGDALQKIDFSVVQTYTFIGKNDAKTRSVLDGAKRMFSLDRPEIIQSPVGLAHAYDLTHLLSLAIKKAGSTDRRAIRRSLEELGRYKGLIKIYERPFTKKRHEALSQEDVFLARYTKEGYLVPLK